MNTKVSIPHCCFPRILTHAGPEMTNKSNMNQDQSGTEVIPTGTTRRKFLNVAGGLAFGSGYLALTRTLAVGNHTAKESVPMHLMGTVGRVDSEYPETYLRTFRRGTPVPNDALEKARSEGWPKPDVFYEIHAIDREIEIAKGIFFPAWTFGLRRDGDRELPLLGNIPGPTLRCLEGDEILIKFVNQGTHPHTIHFHGIHQHEFDGALPYQFVYPGQEFWYRFTAEPYGLHLYHCHSSPLKRHIHKGLYGVFIVDPRRGARTTAGNDPNGRAQEYVMMLNGFDTNFDGDNEIYALNTVASYYTRDHSIPVTRNTLVRMYVVNITEFDPINSLHVHANFFYAIRTGTRIMTWGDEAHMEENKHRFEFTDTIMLCQAERAIIEMKFPYEGNFMFHAHQSEFAELGWMAFFKVVAPK